MAETLGGRRADSKFLLAASMIAFIGLSGCAESVPPLTFSISNVEPSQNRVNAEVKSLTVTFARSDELIGPIDLAGTGSGEEVIVAWNNSMKEALDRSFIFRDDGQKKVFIAVKVLKLYVRYGFSMTTDVVARYEVIDRSNGDIFYTQDIASSWTTPFDYSFDAFVRARESINRAIQNNIVLFLHAAEAIDVDTPMFPAVGETSQ